MRRALLLFVLPLAPALVLGVPVVAAAGPNDGASIARDPPPLTEKGQWVFDLRWDRGDVYLVGVRELQLPQPRTTPRVTGRFALELTERGRLIERVRFDFPGMAVPDDDGGIELLPKIRTRIGVFFPATRRGDKLELVDRATTNRYALPWPPGGGRDAGAADGGR